MGAGKGQPHLRQVSLELPGAPVAVVPTDLDGDGRLDLAVAVVYTVWDQLELEELTRMDDIEGLVEVLTIVPALLDRRELFLFLSKDAGYHRAGAPIPLPVSVLSIEAGPEDRGLLALTDDGVSRLRWPAPEGGPPTFEPILSQAPVVAGTGAFFPPLDLVRELDGRDGEDLLLPTADGYSLYRNRGGELSPEPVQQNLYPEFEDLPTRQDGDLILYYPLPEVRDTDGDGLPDLLFRHPLRRGSDLRLAKNLGGRFSDLSAPLRGFGPLAQDRESEEKGETEGRQDGEQTAGGEGGGEEAAVFEDLDGDGKSELVTLEQIEKEAEGLKEELEDARRPEFRYRIYPQRPDNRLAELPSLEFQAEGYILAGDPDFPFPGGFQDLDGDGRKDLVTVTLDFSVLQAVRIMATQRISIGLDFHIWCQEADGRGYHRVPDLDLSGKFKLNLRNLRLNQLSQFAGDFNGDGRADFLQIGRGKRVSIHLGREGCTYPRQADLVIDLSQEPQDLTLVQVRDLNGDEVSDLQIIQPLPPRDEESSAPVRLELYLSGGRS